MGRDWQREYLHRPHWQQPDRFPSSAAEQVDNGRYHHDSTDVSVRAMGIDRALREQCRIPAQYYFVSAILDNGEKVTFSGPTRYEELVPKFFNMDKWVRCATSPATSAAGSMANEPDLGFEDYPRSSMVPEYSGRRPYERRRAPGLDDFDGDTYRHRKRARGAAARRAAERDDDAPGKIVSTKKFIEIGNDKAVWDVYDLRFRNLQQTACKLIAKAWVKLVEPKKQSTHPYTGSDDKAPPWWPKPWGITREEKVRHKEPDHLYKKERVHLLKHILRLVVEPNAKQHPDIQKLHLTVAKLEEATNEALSSFFGDRDVPANGKKKPYLKEIFYVAKHEERYKNGEIDGNTHVYIMGDDKIPDNYQSDNEDGSPSKDDDEPPEPISVSSSVSPARAGSHGMIPPPSTSDHSPGSSLPGPPPQLMGGSEISHHRGYAPQMMHSDYSSDQHTTYVEAGGLGVNNQHPIAPPHSGMALHHEMLPNPHDAGRRSSLFNSPPDFASAPAPPMYSTWQPGSTAPNNPPMYSFPPQQHTHAPTPPPFVPQPVSMAQSQAYMGPSFDGMPRTPYDPGHDGLFRTGNVTPGPVHPHTYPQIQHLSHPHPHDSRAMPGGGLKAEPSGRGHLQ